MKEKILFLILGVALAFTLIFNTWGLTESSEARYAEISREMYLNKDFLHPKLLDIKHFHKPPVTYYITAVAYAIFGVNEFAARFFLVVALFFQCVLVYKITGMLFQRNNLAAIATLIYFSFPIAQVAARNLTTDCYLTTFIFAAIYFFLRFRAHGKVIHIYLFSLFCALSFLTKGPVGILPQGLFALGHTMMFTSNKKFSMHHLLAAMVCILLSASWFLILVLRDPELWNYFVGHQVVDRVANDAFSRGKPFWYYFAYMPLVGLPMVLVLARNYARHQLQSSDKKIFKLLLLTFIGCFLVFSLSTSKLILYVLPLYLFISIFGAVIWESSAEKFKALFSNIIYIFYLVILLALVLAHFFVTSYRIPLLETSCILFVGGAITTFLRFRTAIANDFRAPAIAAAGIFSLILFMPVFMHSNELKANSIKPLVESMRNKKPGSGGIIVYNYLLPSLAFYEQDLPITIYNGNSSANREIQFENDTLQLHRHYISVKDDQAFLQALPQKNIRYIIAQKTDPIPDSLSYLVMHLSTVDSIGKWIVYY